LRLAGGLCTPHAKQLLPPRGAGRDFLSMSGAYGCRCARKKSRDIPYPVRFVRPRVRLAQLHISSRSVRAVPVARASVMHCTDCFAYVLPCSSLRAGSPRVTWLPRAGVRLRRDDTVGASARSCALIERKRALVHTHPLRIAASRIGTRAATGVMAATGRRREAPGSRSGSPHVHSADPSTGLSTPRANPLNPFLLPASKHNYPHTFHSDTDSLTTARYHYPSWYRRFGPLNLAELYLTLPGSPTKMDPLAGGTAHECVARTSAGVIISFLVCPASKTALVCSPRAKGNSSNA
jgi:hypothetical protein